MGTSTIIEIQICQLASDVVSFSLNEEEISSLINYLQRRKLKGFSQFCFELQSSVLKVSDGEFIQSIIVQVQAKVHKRGIRSEYTIKV